MKNLIKPAHKRSNERYFTGAEDLMRVPPQTDFFLRQILAEISNFIINSVIKVAGEKPVPGVKYDSAGDGRWDPDYFRNVINSIMIPNGGECNQPRQRSLRLFRIDFRSKSEKTGKNN